VLVVLSCHYIGFARLSAFVGQHPACSKLAEIILYGFVLGKAAQRGTALSEKSG